MLRKRFLFPEGTEEEASDPSFLFCKRAGALGPPRHLPGQVKGLCSSRSKGSTVQSTSLYCRETSSVPPGGWGPWGTPAPLSSSTLPFTVEEGGDPSSSQVADCR